MKRGRTDSGRGSLALVACAAAVASGCTLECELPECDIRKPQCQDAVADAVSCVRGGEARDITLEVVDAYEFIDAETDAAMDTACADLWYDGLATFSLVSGGLNAAEQTRIQLQRVGAFYSSADDRVTVLDRGHALDGAGATLTLFHEMVHALQNAEYDLEPFWNAHGDRYDAWLALRAVTEGEAELYEGHALALGRGFALDDLNWERAHDAYRAASFADAVRAEHPFVVLRSDFVYAFGVTYVQQAWEAGGRDAVRGLYDDLPTTTRQIMLGSGTQALEDDAELVPRVSDHGFEYVGSARLGSYALAVVLRRYWDNSVYAVQHDEPVHFVTDPPPAPDEARVHAALTGDTFALFQNPGSGAVLASWQLRFATVKDAEAAAAIMRIALRWEGADERDVAVSGSTVRAIALGSVPSTDLSALAWEPLPPRDGLVDLDCVE